MDLIPDQIIQKIIVFVYFLLNSFQYSSAYKPVVIMHGILSGAESMMELSQGISVFHPGTKIYNCDLYTGWYSLENSWKQVNELSKFIESIGKLHPEGINVIGYSQGGLLARVAIQTLVNHNVKTFISLSSPQAGQFGSEFLHLIFPSIAAKEAYQLFYSRIGQLTSVGNYWNDPYKQDLYLKTSEFLPYINNELPSFNSSKFKSNLVRLEKMILVGGPDDEVITPWTSSQFGFYNSSMDILPFYKRNIYLADTIGLKTLNERGKLKVITKAHIHHTNWPRNRDIIRDIVMNHLD